jgi:hypothetical protein
MKSAPAILAGLLFLTIGAPASASDRRDVETPGTFLKPGDAAPALTLLSNEWKPVSLSDYRGKQNVILAFYVLAFTGG